LALVAITARRTRTSVASFHLSSLLLVTFSVYVYRDVWPLLTFTLVPADRWEGALLWAKIGLLSVPGIVITYDNEENDNRGHVIASTTDWKGMKSLMLHL